MLDFRAVEQKWRDEWEKQKAFEADADLKRKKFFVTFPYPYMNGYLHLGHFYSIMRTEVFARYKRLRGFNVLFPQAWHCTGSPIESAAKRIREQEPKQLQSMKLSGFSDEEAGKFADPKFWTEFFPKAAKKDLIDFGLGIDFRRSFITTDLNPHYNKFIEWQFRKLKENSYIVKGNHPVVWCPKDNWPVGDHDRVEGEGETPQEFLLIRHRLPNGTFLLTATLRPDTILGITNIYINPDATYAEIEAKGERWIVGEPCIPLLEAQGFNPKKKGAIRGLDLIGKKARVFGERDVLILPATFIDPSFGTGIVHSVPSDSSDDLIALWDLQKDGKTIKKYNLPREEILAIKPIAVLNTPGYGEVPAEVLLKQYKVGSQNDKKLLDKIRNELYRISFYSATFNELYKDFFSISLAGKPVQQYKALLKEELIKGGHAHPYYQLTGKVVCRCLTPSVVKVISDQWFLTYANPEWKKEAHSCLEKMRLYPEKSRQQFDYVIDWLQNWACVREYGLGTKLPWDKKWVIEALSDSTIYMAYYTIAHLIKEEPVDNVDDALFDYVFLSKGNGPKAAKAADKMKSEFDYWYPMDFRNSGKDLIQNHLAMCVFNHTAIFKKNHWPQSFGVNGWVTVDGKKMSKSLGNFILLKDLVKSYPVDVSRVTILSGGEGLDDPNWDSEFAKACTPKIQNVFELCAEHYNKGRLDAVSADQWMESTLHLIIRDATAHMEETLFRSALQKIFFDLPKAMRQYLRKTSNSPNRIVMGKAIEAQIVMLSPFAPFTAEELWQKIGKKGMAMHAEWPSYDAEKIDEKATYIDGMVSAARGDIDAVLHLAKVGKPKKITLFIAPPWKYRLMALIKEQMEQTRNPGDILRAVMSTELKQHGSAITGLIPRLVSNTSIIPALVLSQDQEQHAFEEAKSLYQDDLGCGIEIIKAQDSTHQKAQQALPGKPAIIVE